MNFNAACLVYNRCDGGPKFTKEIGCYVTYKNYEPFPRCCPRIVCHGKDADFDMTEYFNYLKMVLRTHVAAAAYNTTNTYTERKTNIHVLP